MEKLLIHLNIEHAVCLSLALKHWNANEARTECLLRCFGVSFGVRRDSNVLSRGTFRNGSSPRFAHSVSLRIINMGYNYFMGSEIYLMVGSYRVSFHLWASTSIALIASIKNSVRSPRHKSTIESTNMRISVPRSKGCMTCVRRHVKCGTSTSLPFPLLANALTWAEG